jgi:hypothetical protein
MKKLNRRAFLGNSAAAGVASGLNIFAWSAEAAAQA